MTPEVAVQLVREALIAAFFLAAPLLAVGFVIGIVMSLVQIVTSIQDSAFSTVPRLMASLGALLVSLPWLVSRSIAYTSRLLENIGSYAQ
jgi:flagellar biosynthesis protein FliQ